MSEITKEEAIEEIKSWTPILLSSAEVSEKAGVAQEMAISALSEIEEIKEPALLESFKDGADKVVEIWAVKGKLQIRSHGVIHNCNGKFGNDISVKSVNGSISIFPGSAGNKGGWTPITEEMPEDGEDVLFCDINEDVMLGYHVKGYPRTHFAQRGSWECVKNVVAWQPKPESYKSEAVSDARGDKPNEKAN